MKAKFLLILFIVFIVVGTSSCVTYTKVKPPHKEKRIPPGQMKKIAGSKSAKYYAPGHNK